MGVNRIAGPRVVLLLAGARARKLPASMGSATATCRFFGLQERRAGIVMRNIVMRATAMAVASAAAACLLTSAAPAKASRPHHHHRAGPLFGIFTGQRPVPAGLHPAIVQDYTRLPDPFPLKTVVAIHEHGELPLVDVDPYHITFIAWPEPGIPDSREFIDASMRVISDGIFDRYLRAYADSIRNLHFRIALSFGHEMNGTWYGWGWKSTPPWLFTAMWRHIHSVFAQQGATNVTWVWTISKIWHTTTMPAKQLNKITREEWPGWRYVNWVGVDFYFHHKKWRFRRLSGTISFVRRLTRKPILITETGIFPNPHEYQQLSSLFAGIRRDHLLGFMYMDRDGESPWHLTPRELRCLQNLLHRYMYKRGIPGTSSPT